MKLKKDIIFGANYRNHLIGFIMIIAICCCNLFPLFGSENYSTQLYNGNSFNYIINVDKISQRWSFDPSSDQSLAVTNFMRSSRPTLSSDGAIVYVFGEKDSGNEGQIIALDAFYGEKIWSCDVVTNADTISWSSPIYSDGYLYWAGSNGLGESFIYKINGRNGSILESFGGWKVKLPDSVEIVNASPTVGGGKLFISSYGGDNPSNCKHYALNIDNGSIAWSNSDGGSGQGAMAFDSVRNLVYQSVLSDGEYKLRAYSVANGDIAWTSSWKYDFPPYHCAIILKSDKLYMQTYDFHGDGNIYVANAANNGELLWSQATPKSGDNAPTVDNDGNVYTYGDYSGVGQTRAYDKDGNILWTNEECGGWKGVAASSGDYIFSGIQTGDLLKILKKDDGASVATVAGSGPVAFGDRTFFTVGSNGILYAHSTGNDFANSVTTYTPGSGIGNDFIDNDKSYNIPTTALNRPTVDTTGDDASILESVAVPVVNVYPPCRATELVTIGGGGELILKFDHPVTNNKNNKFGIDLIVYGNAPQRMTSGSWGNGNPNDVTTTASVGYEKAIISVSEDGTTWHEFTSGPFGDDFCPTFGRVYDDVNPHKPNGAWNWNSWWGAPTDATLPLDPTWDGSKFNGKTVKEGSLICGKSAGGTGFDIAALGLEKIQYVKIIGTDSVFPEIDAIADARISNDTTSTAPVQTFTASLTDKDINLSWANPIDEDFAGVIILRQKNSSVTTQLPVSGVAYFANYNSTIGASEIVYCGNGSTFTDSSLTGGTYNYKIYSFDQSLNYSSAQDTSKDIVIVKYSLTFSTDGSAGASITGNISQEVIENENSTEVIAIPPTGYTFTNWTGDNGFITTSNPTLTVLNVTTNMTITANFAIKSYTITYNAGANGVIDGAISQTLNHGSTGSIVTAIPDSGYHFVNWSDIVSVATRKETNVKSDLSFTANFAIDGAVFYELTVENGSGDTSCEAGTFIPITADTPDNHYHFQNWSTSSGGSFESVNSANTIFTMPTGNTVVTANFAIDTYTLTYSSDENGSITGDSNQVIDYSADGTTVTATPNSGYHFTSWSDGKTDPEREDLNITENIALSANFAINSYTLTYSTDGNGTIFGELTQSVIYNENGTEITALPSEHYMFIEWSDGVTTASRIDQNVNSDISVTALFALDLEKITVGSLITLLNSDLPEFNELFSRRPRVYGTFRDPQTLKTKKSTTKAITKINSKNKSTFFNSLWIKTVTLYNRKSLRTSQKSGKTIQEWLDDNPIQPLVCNLYAIAKKSDGFKLLDKFKTLQIVPPTISEIVCWDGSDASSGVHKDSILILKGHHFGYKPPHVSLEYIDIRGKIKYKRLKVIREYKYSDYKGKANRSCMDKDSGASELRILMPKRTLNVETYKLILNNKVGIALDSNTKKLPTIKVIYESNNSAPIAIDDSISIDPTIRTHMIDVLKNDSDAESDNVKIILNEKLTNIGAKISVKKGKIYYSLPRILTTKIDQFTYIIDDNHGKTSTATVRLMW